MAVFASPRTPPAARPGQSSYAFSDRFEKRALTFISPPVGPYTEALQNQSEADPEGALRHSTVWACADLIASCMSMLTPWAYEGAGVGFGEAIRVQNQPDILLQPGSGADIYDHLYMGTMSRLVKGNEFGQVAARDRQYHLPVQVELENPGVVRVKKLQDGTYEYKFRDEIIPAGRLWHKAMYRFPGSPLGMNPLQYAVRVTRLGLAAEHFGAQYFEDGGHPSALLTNDKLDQINVDDAKTFKQRFMSALRGSREPVVMAGGWTYQKIQINPDESQFLDTQKLSDTKICRYMGRVPPELVGAASEGSAITYANLEQRAMHFLTFTMYRWIKRWEMDLGACMPAGLYVKFDTDALQRVDFLSQWTGLHMAIGSRIMTQAEGREKADLSNTRTTLMAPAIEAELDKLVTPLAPPVLPVRQGE